MTEAVVTTPWYQGVEGFNEEAVGHLRAKGWDTLPAPQVAAHLVKSWKEAEKLIGAPANEIIRLPKDMKDEAAMKAVYQRLGAPADAKDYDLSNIKRPDGTPIDQAFSDFLRKTAADLNLPKDAAPKLAATLVKQMGDADATALAEKTAKLAEDKTALKTNWGKNFEANMFVARKAAEALGVKPEDVSALEGVVGYNRVMELFRNIGAKMGEDKFVSSASPTGGAMTREEAVARKAELMADKDWVKRYNDGGMASKEFKEFQALHVIIEGNVQAA